MIHVLQIGLGPLGIQIAQYITQKTTVKTVAGVDINPKLKGKTFSELDSGLDKNIPIFSSIEEAMNTIASRPDVAIITTVSDLERLIPQIEEVAKWGIPIVSTCEELSYPWQLQPELSATLDNICKVHNIACLGTGVNPGFLMDYLPSVLVSISKEIDHIKVERVQNATPRRLPFQQKIGAGLSLDAFKAKEMTGTLRHVGLKESVYLLANSIGWELDEVTETLAPVVATTSINSGAIEVAQGDARGVEQISHGFYKGECKITMHFKAAIGEPKSYDKVIVQGIPSFSSEIENGINGDIATCAITINSIKSVLIAPSGLVTMADIAVPGFIK